MRLRILAPFKFFVLLFTFLAAAPAFAAGFSPSTTKSIISTFQAVGNGVADDTAALQRALNVSASFCLDGEGHTFKVVGVLKAKYNLCLKNITLVQSLVPVNTAQYIRSLGRGEPVLTPTDEINYPEDPVVAGAAKTALENSLGVRTLLIRPDPGAAAIAVTLQNVKVVYGLYPEGGSRAESTGLWLENTDNVYFAGVECTGYGHGTCIMIYNSSNMILNSINIHDMLWAPHAGDRPLVESHIKNFLGGQGWNDFPIYEYRPALAKFVQVRVQEQAVGLVLNKVTNAVVSNLKMLNVLAKFDTANLAIQTDGVDLNSCTNITIRSSRIARIWEGIDMVGGSGMSGVTLDGVTIWDAWNFGYKVGYNTANVMLKNGEIHDTGIAGIVISSPARSVYVDNMAIRDTGYVDTPIGSKFPWPNMNRAGVMINGAIDVHIANTSSEYNVANGWALYGFYNDTRGNTLASSHANGYSRAATYGF